jgi:hypothetical protein
MGMVVNTAEGGREEDLLMRFEVKTNTYPKTFSSETFFITLNIDFATCFPRSKLACDFVIIRVRL